MMADEGATTSSDDEHRAAFDRLDDATLRTVFEFVGPSSCYLCLALTCRKWNDILRRQDNGGMLPCYCEQRPFVCHPTGEWILRGSSRSSEYRWSCCQGSVNDPGCVQDDYCQDENDRERARHQERVFYDGGGSSFPVDDSLEWCERHCRCGYNDGVHASCKKDSLKAAQYPADLDSHSDTECSSGRKTEDHGYNDGVHAYCKKDSLKAAQYPADLDSHSDTESSSGRKTKDHDSDSSIECEFECYPVSSVCCPHFELGDFLESEDDDGDASGLIFY